MEVPIQWHPHRKPTESVKLQLIQPPDDDAGTRRMWVAPIGLELIAHSLNGIAEVEIIDGSNRGMDYILGALDGEYIGVQDWYTKHENSLTLLRAAKEKGATTLIGGPNANHLAERLLANNDFIDYVVIEDGEDAVRQLISGVPPEIIPNLCYRNESGEPVRNKIVNAKLDRTFDLEHILDLDLSMYGKEPFPISSVRGCIKAELGERCSFCSISHSLKVMQVDKVWEQIDLLWSKYGIDYFLETGDSFLIGHWPDKLLEARPDHLKHIKFQIYAGIEEITEQNIDVSRRLGVIEMFVGVEHTDIEVLRRIKKEYTIEEINTKLQMVSDAGIQAHAPFMLGLPGETSESLENTYQFIKHTAETRPETKLMVNIPVPIFGTDLFDELQVHPEVSKIYNSNWGNLDKDDSFDYELLIRLQTKWQTSIDYAELLRVIQKARDVIGRGTAGDLRRWKLANTLAAQFAKT
jgi:radical SAM superfamily enzyme YgiQ (UPF0313 family)